MAKDHPTGESGLYQAFLQLKTPAECYRFLQDVCSSVQIPVYGIGGIKIDGSQLHELQNAGAAGGCVMSGMMQI